MSKERFTSRWGLILAALGMAIGTGNVWRFPRILALNGGGTFLLPWLFFLFSWSIPLLIIESAMGKRSRKGTIGSFALLTGPANAWRGAFVGFCTMAISFYYCVVAGWCGYYFVLTISGRLDDRAARQTWDQLAASGGVQVAFFALALAICTAVVWRGVTAGIERVNRLLIPALFVILVISALRAVTLPGSVAGLQFMFSFEPERLTDYRIWLEALSQSAWSTGAGWGLLLTYAVYMKEKQNLVFSSVITGLGNNSASLLAAMALIPTVFAVLPHADALAALQESGPASTGMTFIYFPEVLGRIPAGNTVFAPLFFLALSIAAVSSMISMIELGVRNVADFGVSRSKALSLVAALTFFLGLPSALSQQFFLNQDWVWGLGLLVSGFFFALAARGVGAERLLDRWVNRGPRWRVGKWFAHLVFWWIPLQFVVLLGWWLYQAAWVYDPERWWDPFRTFSLGTVVAQWALVIVVFRLLNRRMSAAGEDHGS